MPDAFVRTLMLCFGVERVALNVVEARYRNQADFAVRVRRLVATAWCEVDASVDGWTEARMQRIELLNNPSVPASYAVDLFAARGSSIQVNPGQELLLSCRIRADVDQFQITAFGRREGEG